MIDGTHSVTKKITVNGSVIVKVCKFVQDYPKKQIFL